jgi:DNA-binding Xre family transcriptional regulator
MHGSTYQGFGGTLVLKSIKLHSITSQKTARFNTHDNEKLIPFTILNNLCGILCEICEVGIILEWRCIFFEFF